MARIMFPFSEKELQRRESQPELYKPKVWWKQGFFKECDPQMAAQENRSGKTFLVRCWLHSALRAAPLPASTVLRLAREEGFNEWALRRAKKYHGIKSVKVGGRYKGWGAVWVWQLPVSKLQDWRR